MMNLPSEPRSIPTSRHLPRSKVRVKIVVLMPTRRGADQAEIELSEALGEGYAIAYVTPTTDPVVIVYTLIKWEPGG